jgi:DNA repair protein RadC
MRHQRVESPLKINGVAAAREFFSGCFAEQDRDCESLFVAHLDAEGRCVHLSRHDGTAASVDLPLRAIVLDAARHGSAALIVAHNHPSGDARPSESDLRATRRLAVAAEALDCRLLDHFIFARSDCRSLRRLGYL